ncbi:MAG: hypothetical protein JW827_02265 [Spirochaetes bacterium]|nr:hypothetical protein [Spirochaetota bacterium]
MKFKKIISQDLLKSENIYYFSFGLATLLFPLTKSLTFLIIMALIGVNEGFPYLDRFKGQFTGERVTLRWILGSALVLSIIFKPAYIGFFIILNTLVDRFSGIMRHHYLLHKKFPFSRKDYSGFIFFFAAGIVLGLAYFYFFKGFILKQDGVVIFLTTLFAAALESVNPFKVNDNISLSLFSGIFMYLTGYVDFFIHISGLNFVFGFVVCAIFIVILILADIIKFKEVPLSYGLLLILYTGLRYHLFVFNLAVFVGFCVLFKVEKRFIHLETHPKRMFSSIHDFSVYLFLALIMAGIFIFIPAYRFIRASLATGILAGLLFYGVEIFDKLFGKTFFNIFSLKKSRQSENSLSREALFMTLGSSLVYMILGYLLHIFKLKNIIPVFFLCHLSWYAAFLIIKKWPFTSHQMFNIKFLISYIPFSLMLIISTL